jgi:hypothetical protein
MPADDGAHVDHGPYGTMKLPVSRMIRALVLPFVIGANLQSAGVLQGIVTAQNGAIRLGGTLIRVRDAALRLFGGFYNSEYGPFRLRVRFER